MTTIDRIETQTDCSSLKQLDHAWYFFFFILMVQILFSQRTIVTKKRNIIELDVSFHLQLE